MTATKYPPNRERVAKHPPGRHDQGGNLEPKTMAAKHPPEQSIGGKASIQRARPRRQSIRPKQISTNKTAKHPPNCNDLSNETDDGDMKRRQDDEDDDHHHRHHAKNDATTG